MIKLAIIGTGGMANTHADNFSQLRGCKIVAACDVDQKRVQEFAAKHKIPHTFTTVEDLLQWGRFDAASNVTPDPFHAPISLALLAGGKHVLCEKPLAVCYSDAAEMVRAARKAGVINMVNFSYRNHSAIHKAHALVSKGVLGRLLHVEATYFQSWLSQNGWGDWHTNPAWLWRLSTAHGSKGVLGDVGVHLLDFASYPAGDIASVYCRLKTFPKAPGGKIGEYRLDANDSAVITAEFTNGALGSLRTTRWATGHHNSITLALYGEEGALKIDLDRSGSELELCRVKQRKLGAWATVKCAKTPSMYQRFLTGIRTEVQDQPDFARGAAIQKALDACEQSHRESRTISL
ncbi:MAG: Gfo/Idh/MocA family oxidoreductase [Chthoniobacteraceae bacterium]|nr:Gfo/Idh/MocA family oxidoreductase [Chthoniobacteraceae bacterium]